MEKAYAKAFRKAISVEYRGAVQSDGEMRDDFDKLAATWRAAGIAPSVVAHLELSKRIMRLSGILEQALKVELAELGLTYAEFDVLAALHRSGPLKSGELSRSLLLTSGGTSNVIQRLQAAGYVEREVDPEDKRSHWARLSETGAALMDKAMDISVRLHEDVFSRASDAAVNQAVDALRDILVALGPRRMR